MFRKPKAKGNTRQRIKVEDDEDELGEPANTVMKKENEPVMKIIPQTLLSFDDTEGADDNFEIKKSKRYQKDQKRQKRLEEKAAREWKEEEDDDIIVHIKTEPADDITVGSLRATSINTVKQEVTIEEDDNIHESSRSFHDIPDSRAVYEAKKKREEMRRNGRNSDYIPLDNDRKLNNKGERKRLVREDENDDSDDETQSFYSARNELKEEEERRRDVHYQMLSKNEEEEERNEMDEWERMQIEKAMSNRNIGELRQKKMEDDYIMDEYKERFRDNKNEVEMDIDIEEDIIITNNDNPNCESLNIESILDKLKLRMDDRVEYLNRKRLEVSNLENDLTENEETTIRLRNEGPHLKTKHEMLQRIRTYSICLLECLDEKLDEVNRLMDGRRKVLRDRKERIEKRRRRDIKDCYEECSALSSGKDMNKIRIGEHQLRYSDREGRKGKRRREREKNLCGISHEEGMSSDNEEINSQSNYDSITIEGIIKSSNEVFTDTLSEFSSLTSILSRILEWFWTDSKSFNDSFIGLCLPKLSSHFVRLELLRYDLLKKDLILSEMEWYNDILRISQCNGMKEGIEYDDIIISLIPNIIHKVIIPFIIDVICEEWEPLSYNESLRLSTILRTIIMETPPLHERSKPLRRMLEVIIKRFNESIDEDLFVPMFGRSSMDNPNTGCRSFLDRQFWSAIKLMKCVGLFNGVISDDMIAQLSLSIANRVCILALQLVDMSEPHVIIKTRSLLKVLNVQLLSKGRPNELRGLITCLTNIVNLHTNNKEFSQEVKSVISSIDSLV